MPKGITQDQVNAAADSLVADGENPTVDKIRNALGTGSPNTVLRMLEVWRNQLAGRLQRVIELPALPPEVGQAVADLWRIAIEHASALSTNALEVERNALFAAQSDLTQERKVWEISLANAEALSADHQQKTALIEAQADERQARVNELSAQVKDLLRQRDQLEMQLKQLNLERDALLAERRSMSAHQVAQENRSHRMVDDARQELKQLKHQHEQERRRLVAEIAERDSAQDALKTRLHEVEQLATRHAGRVEALESTIRKLMAARRAAPTPKREPKKTPQKTSRMQNESPRSPKAKK